MAFMRFTRREWAILFGTAPLAAEMAQSPATESNANGLEKAIADVHKVSERLSKLEVPMNVEPAFQFKA